MGVIDERLFLWLNGMHAGWMDSVMVALTEMWPWIPIYLLWAFLVIRQFGKRSVWVFLAVALVIMCSDQLSAHVCKPLFHRLRPCFNPELEGLVHLPKGYPGGQYGFVSSHAANTFAIAAFLTAILRKPYRWVGWTLYGWAVISSYTRIYIGVHYPGDIFAGAVLGILVGLILWRIWKLVFKDHLNGGANVDAP